MTHDPRLNQTAFGTLQVRIAEKKERDAQGLEKIYARRDANKADAIAKIKANPAPLIALGLLLLMLFGHG